MAILAVLIGLMLAAVQNVREGANRMSCANNLKQLGLACACYDNSHGRLPPGYLGPIPNERLYGADADRFQHIGLLVYLLPYVEQDNLHRQLQVNFNPRQLGQAWYLNPVNWRLAQTRIRLFECLSDNIAEDTSSWGTAQSFHFYHYDTRIVPNTDDGTADDAVMLAPADPTVLGRTNYFGCGGLAGHGTNQYWSRYEGIFSNRSDTSLARIPDGTSSTLLLGEAYGGDDNGQRAALPSWMGVGAVPTWGGLPKGGEVWLYPAHFNSKHPEVVQFCFADGSVHALRKGTSWIDWWNWDLANLWPDQYPTDWWVLQELAGKRDGGIRDSSTLVNN
jgi:hypothetical protein